MTKKDKAEKKALGYRNKSEGWGRNNMTKTHRKGRKASKKEATRAGRRFSKAEVLEAARSMKPGGLRDVDHGTYEIGSKQREVAKDLKKYSRNLTAAMQRASSVTPSLLRTAADLLEHCGEQHEGCIMHGNVVHGKEAEELRSGLESFLERWRASDNTGSMDAMLEDISKLLDEVDARDSLAYVEQKKGRRPDICCGSCGDIMKTVLVCLAGPGDDNLLIDERVKATPKQWCAFVEAIKPGVTRL